MIAVLLTPAAVASELAAEWQRWLDVHGKPPNVIVGHDDLPFDLVGAEHATVDDDGDGETTYHGVRVLTLDQFYDLHASDFGIDDEDDEEED